MTPSLPQMTQPLGQAFLFGFRREREQGFVGNTQLVASVRPCDDFLQGAIWKGRQFAKRAVVHQLLETGQVACLASGIRHGCWVLKESVIIRAKNTDVVDATFGEGGKIHKKHLAIRFS